MEHIVTDALLGPVESESPFVEGLGASVVGIMPETKETCSTQVAQLSYFLPVTFMADVATLRRKVTAPINRRTAMPIATI